MKQRRSQQIARWHKSPRGSIAVVAALALFVVVMVMTEIGPGSSSGIVIVLSGRTIQMGSSWSSLGGLARIAMFSLKALARVWLIPFGAGSLILLGIAAVIVLHVASGLWTHRRGPAPLCEERR